MLKARRASVVILLLIMISFISLMTLTHGSCSQNLLPKILKLNVEEATAFSAFSIFNSKGQSSASFLLNQTKRMDIYNLIKDNPGLHFRALSTFLNLPIGVLQYHLGLLVNGGLLSTFRDGRYKRYFESRRFKETEMRVISVLRNQTSGRILVSLFEKPETTHRELASKLNISSQALSWQMNRLKKINFVRIGVEGLNVKYSLDPAIAALVDRYAMPEMA